MVNNKATQTQMKKILLVALALTLGVSSYAQFENAKNFTPKKGGAKTLPTWHQISQDVTGVDFLTGDTISTLAIRNSGKGMIIDLSATWCIWCWVMHSNGILEAIQEELGDSVQCIWVEADPSTTDPGEITGTGQTQGDWTNGGTVPYPIINDHTFANIIGGTSVIVGYPIVVFVSPTGYWCEVYDEDWGFGPYDSDEAVASTSTLMNIYPKPGVAPVVNISGPTTVVNGATVTFTADYVSVDEVTDITWTFEGATTTSANTQSVTNSWTTDGTYTVSLSVTNTTGTTNTSITITVISWNWAETMGYGLTQNDDQAGAGFTAGNPSVWGVMFPAQHLTGRQYLKYIDIYAVGTMNYTMKIYQGGDNAPSDLIYSRVVKGAGEGWQRMNCSGAVALDQTKNLWVTFSAPATGYVMSTYYTASGDEFWYSGDPNSCWVQLSGSWGTMPDYGYDVSWAIKATTGNEPNAGISETLAYETNVYPNPTTGLINVSVENLQSVEVMDITGRTVMTSNESTINMSNLANGVYMLRINTIDGSTMQKVVKR